MGLAALLADVARAAGVSIATASRALNAMQGVSARTRERVLEAAEQLHYALPVRPESRSQARVAVVAPRLDTWFHGRAVTAVAERLESFGCIPELRVLSTGAQRRKLWQTDDRRRLLHAVLLVGLAPDPGEQALIASAGLPVRGLCAGALTGSVGPDAEALARCAVEHLVGLGHRRIAMVEGTDPPVLAPRAGPARTAGFRTALGALDLDVEPMLVEAGGFSADGGYLATGRLLSHRVRPTAVVVHSDEMAVGVLRALVSAGLNVPRDVSVVSVDDSWLAAQLELTSVAHDLVAASRAAVDSLLADLLPCDDPELPGVVAVAPQLTLRGSTAPPTITKRSQEEVRR